jgi:hypothetical protein
VNWSSSSSMEISSVTEIMSSSSPTMDCASPYRQPVPSIYSKVNKKIQAKCGIKNFLDIHLIISYNNIFIDFKMTTTPISIVFVHP